MFDRDFTRSLRNDHLAGRVTARPDGSYNREDRQAFAQIVSCCSALR